MKQMQKNKTMKRTTVKEICNYYGQNYDNVKHMKEFINGCNQWRQDVHGSIMRVDSYDLAKIADITVPAT